MKHQQQRGVALVVTLILLSVITFLAVAFLALSRRDKAAVNVSLSQTDARFMSDTALARAEAELVSRMIAKGTLLDYDLMVTRNYIRTNGFLTGESNLLNVNYDFYPGGINTNISAEDRLINIGNLFYDPRPPVYVSTNGNENEPLDFRYYVDFNRNRQFDSNGFFRVFDENGGFIGTNVVLTIGDPEWIGILEKPQYPHSGTNRFIGRYAYLVVPEGKTLDINFIHNYGKKNGNTAMPASDEGFFRNLGVGSWEMNLAAFLLEVNTNMYAAGLQYQYDPDVGDNSQGKPFEDAYNILRYRYGNNNLPSAQDSLDNPNLNENPTIGQIFQRDLVDLYSDGPLFDTLPHSNYVALVDQDTVSRPWPGSRNPRIYRDIQELFDPTKSSQDFVNRLNQTTSSNSTYNRGTITRLLTQLGTSSDVDNYYVVNGQRYPKIHLNYDNLVQTNGPGIKHQTNFFEWEPLAFFTNAAEALIRKSLIRADKDVYYLGGPVRTNFNLTNIMVYPTNEYTPSVHRLLQLAANIIAARTNYVTITGESITNFPVVFRPQFSREGTNIFISGYVEETTNGVKQFEKGFRDMQYATNRNAISTFPAKSDENIVGVPWVVSAKKGLPNFNEFSVETAFQITRKMELRKPNSDPETDPNEANLMYLVDINNFIGTEFWNSYTSAFTASINIRFTNNYQAALLRTNPAPVVVLSNLSRISGYNRTVSGLQGVLNGKLLNTNSFVIDHGTIPFLPTRAYIPRAPWFTPNTNKFEKTPISTGFYVPDWHLFVTNQAAAIVTHEVSGRVIDFVNLGSTVTYLDINKELNGPEVVGGETQPEFQLWHTNYIGETIGGHRLRKGLQLQLDISLGNEYLDNQRLWDEADGGGRDAIKVREEINKFRHFMPGATPFEPGAYVSTNAMQVPFSPTRTIYVRDSYQANDPLVHYMAGDLVEPGKSNLKVEVKARKSYAEYNKHNLLQINERYNPWGGNRLPFETTGSPEDTTSFDVSIKDPLVRWSDDWEFPTNKFPNVGWLGRVHRGTPWQTVYMKSPVIESNAWFKWAGSGDTHPTRDWALVDVFTAAPNDNAARGLLSVNQTHQASWSAVLSGVTVLSNSIPNGSILRTSIARFEPVVIEPNSIQLSNIVAGINLQRASTNVQNGVFSSIAELFSTPELTVASPFLNVSNQVEQQRYGVNDAAYERIPQQILSLLKLGNPRVAVYSYGQALRPAPNSIVFNPPGGRPDLQNVCTNYQITGEVVTRTVLRVEGTVENPKAVVESFQILQED